MHAALSLAMQFAHWYMSAATYGQGVRLRPGTGSTQMHQQLRGQEQAPAATQEGAGLDFSPFGLNCEPCPSAARDMTSTVSSLL